MADDHVRVDRTALENFCMAVFRALGLSDYDARAASAVLVAADARGIASHGVGRLWRYVAGLETGLMLPDARSEVVHETPTTVVVDARGAMGAPVSVRTMETVIAKAGDAGAAFGSVRDSNHFGIAGYYATMALEGDMLGIAMTNTAALGVPTWGREVRYGTNPLAFAAPADRERAFVLDMSTTVVTRGKIEVLNRLGERIPGGWAVDRAGRTAHDPQSFLHDTLHRLGGGILPLGGEGEMYGGHKGYGLAVMVDILCALLSSAPFGEGVKDTEASSARVSHFFGAIRIDTFRDPSSFRRDMDSLLESLRTTPPADGAERVWFAGQKEFEMEERCSREGVPVHSRTWDQMLDIGGRYGIEPPTAAG